MCGEKLRVRGRKSPVDPDLILYGAKKIQMAQLAGEEGKMTRLVSEEIAGLVEEKTGVRPDPADIRKKIRKAHASELRVGKVQYIDALRWEWAQYDTYEQWFEEWESFLVYYGYAVNVPLKDETGKIISNITIPDDKKPRIINMDETEIARAGADKITGRRLLCLYNPDLGVRPGTQKTAATGDHETFVGGMNGDGEPTPPFIIFSTTAEKEENFKLNNGMALVGMPTVTVCFGGEPKTISTAFAVTSKGSMDLTLWPQYVNFLVENLYPDVSPTNRILLKVDGGPGKTYVMDLLEFTERGIDFFPG
jgi:hypothetical protein